MEEQDVVHYRIFPLLDELDKKPDDASSVEKRLEELKTQCLSVACPIADGYIWQHEPFNLRVCFSIDDYLSFGQSPKGSISCEEWEIESTVSELSSTDAFVPHLAGKVKFGDNLEDEWFVVFLLFEISRRISHVSITVRDSDGDFLLIESAYYIPNWLRPENSNNRIFIRQGAVHIIPFPRGTPRSRKSSGVTSLRNSLQVLADGVTGTSASEEVQGVIRERIAGYPEKAKKNVHGVRCKVPLPVAQILTHEPQLIALAVESFYNRDIDSMKVASRMEKFSPKCNDGNVNLVDTLVRMSRAMYAQLVQQVFQAPRSYPMPPLNSPGFKEAEIGMKIAVGFEMMYWERSSSERDEALAVEELDDQAERLKGQIPAKTKTKETPTNDVAWKNYRASLERSGYFRGLLDGSKEHRELLQAAVVQYRSSNLFARASMALNAPAKRIDELLSMPHSVEHFSNAGLEQSDDDSWLYNGEEDLASVMLERQKEIDAYESKQEKLSSTKKRSANARNLTSEESELAHAAEVVKNVQSFVNKISSFEGAEIPDKDDGNVGGGEEVDLDMGRLLKELESVFDPKEILTMLSEGLGDDEDTVMSSDLDPDDSLSGSEDDMESADTEIDQLEDTLSSIGALDSTHRGKNEEDITFSDEYSNLLDKELKSSSLAKSFATGREIVSGGSTKDEVSNSATAKAEPVSIETAELGSDDEDDNDLVDVDVNLVESLLRSYMFQEGMPGPASNLLGAMGIDIPDNADQRPGSFDKLKK